MAVDHWINGLLIGCQKPGPVFLSTSPSEDEDKAVTSRPDHLEPFDCKSTDCFVHYDCWKQEQRQMLPQKTNKGLKFINLQSILNIFLYSVYFKMMGLTLDVNNFEKKMSRLLGSF